MSLDIGNILRDSFDSGQVVVRKIRGDDGREKIQMRLDLGLLQMETSGRPDGQRPRGCESLFAFHQQRLEEYRQATGGEEGFELESQDCHLLRSEALLYYHRYVAEFVLEDFEAVERDTTRNLRLMDFCAAYAKEHSDRYLLEQHRPYVIMMRTRACCQRHLRDNHPRIALAEAHKGIGEMQDFFRRFGQEKMIESSGEIAILQNLAHEVRAKMPLDPLDKLKAALDRAIAEERYEEAANLRDRIRKAKEQQGEKPAGDADHPGDKGEQGEG